jgi:hypothetical protein
MPFIWVWARKHETTCYTRIQANKHKLGKNKHDDDDDDDADDNGGGVPAMSLLIPIAKCLNKRHIKTCGGMEAQHHAFLNSKN